MNQIVNLLLIVSLIFYGCKQKTIPSESATINKSDTIEMKLAEIDSMEKESSSLPETADRFFGDFLYDFANKKNFQKQRISFPLKVYKDTTNYLINKNEWIHKQILTDTTIYTSIYASVPAMNLETDTNLWQATVEWIYLYEQNVEIWNFSKNSGVWKLDSISRKTFGEHNNGDFFEFYRLFSTHEAYQQEHIAPTFLFKTYDSETSTDIEGNIDGEQWPIYAPILPNEAFINVNYNQPLDQSEERILMIANPNENQSILLYFRRNTSKGWMLYQLEI